MLRIESITLREIRLALKEPFQISSGTVTHRRIFLVQLRSADGVEYELSGGGKTVKAGGEIETAGTTFDGLRTGEKLVLSGPQGKVTVIANAEPGP